jgi:hypothetical protein
MIDRRGNDYTMKCDGCGVAGNFLNRYQTALIADYKTRGWTRSPAAEATGEHSDFCAQCSNSRQAAAQ